MGDPRSAVASLRAAVAQNHNNAEALSLLSMAENRLKDYHSALAAAQQGLKLAPNNSALLDSEAFALNGMKDYRGNIRRSDIHDPANLYNTYVIYGLPPGPIANPGGEALRAVANPMVHDWLFFVAKGQGRHVFAATYEEHVRNVSKYQLGGRAPPPPVAPPVLPLGRPLRTPAPKPAATRR